MRQVILASGSPRRQYLFRYVVDSFDVLAADIEEIAEGTPEEQVKKLSLDKARHVAWNNPEAVVVGADTLVAIGGHIFGKPADEKDAARMLRKLSGNTHQVYTGVTVIADGKTLTKSACTNVTFNDMTDGEIEEYIETGEPMDKAGAYGIQGYGGKFIQSIDGCYFNVMGLPQSVLYGMLKQFDI